MKLLSANVFEKLVYWTTLNVISCDLDVEDPCLAADESIALQGLIGEAMTGCDYCPPEEM